MIVVVSDASPINYLVLIGHIDLLTKLFDRVLILADTSTPDIVPQWATNLPWWCSVEVVRDGFLKFSEELDSGESAAIALASERFGVSLLMDDAAGRRVAKELGLVTTGTFGVLKAAAERGLVELEDALLLLRTTNFRLSRATVREVMN